MGKKIKLELTDLEFRSLISLADDMAITIGMCDEETAKTIIKQIKNINKMLVRNNLQEFILKA